MRIKNQKDFWAGVMFAFFGAFFSGFGSLYKFGSAANMGPGYFPSVVGIVLILLGMAIVISSLAARAKDEKVEKFYWSTVLLVLGPVVLFGLLLKPLGVIVCLVMLVIISSYASHEFKWPPTLLNAFVLTVLCVAVFVWALQLQFPLWPSFISN